MNERVFAMERVLLIGDCNFGISFFKLKVYSEQIKTYTISDREVQIRLGDEFIKVEAVNNIIKEFSEDERKVISYDNPKILMITYSNKEFLKVILEDKELPKGLLADDLGKIMTLKEFVDRL